MKYLKKAFLYHWNMLLFGAGAVFGLISGSAAVLLPIVLAGEIVYLAALSSNSRFRSAIDALEAPPESPPETDRTLQLLADLSPADRKRFHQIKSLGRKLCQLSMRSEMETDAAVEGIAGIQAEGINRLLWVYLKLLYSKSNLERYFLAVDRGNIAAKIESTRSRLDRLGPPEADGFEEAKKRESLLDTLSTSEKRLGNYDQTAKNYEFIGIELERLHSKIASLSEMGINRQDSRLIMNEIDLASTSIQQTEEAMEEMEFLSDLSLGDGPTPDLLKG